MVDSQNIDSIVTHHEVDPEWKLSDPGSADTMILDSVDMGIVTDPLEAV